MSKRKKLSSQLNNVFNAANDSFSPLSLGNLAAWYRPGIGVTGSLTVSNWADQSGNGRDLAQGTAGNQPIYLPHTGTDYAYLPGVAGNYFSTPDSAANSITGDIDMRVRFAANDYTPSADMRLLAKRDASVDYDFLLETTGKLRFYYSGETPAASSAIPYADGVAFWGRVTRVASSGDIAYYHSADSADVPTAWTALGTATSPAGALPDAAAAVNVGVYNNGDGPLLGKIYSAQIYNGINGALAVDFDPSRFAETSTNGATAVASTGETWTLNSTGAKPAQIVKSASLLFDGTDDYLKTAAFTLNQPTTIYGVVRVNVWGFQNRLWDGDSLNTGGVLMDNGGAGISPNIQQYAWNYGAKDLTNCTVGAYHIVASVLNGASSVLQVDANTAQTGNAGAANAGGIILGAGSTGGDYGKLQAKELIVFSAAHTAAQRAQMQSWLNSRYGTF